MMQGFVNIQSVAASGASAICDWIFSYEDVCYYPVEFCMLPGWGADLCNSVICDKYKLSDELLNLYEKTTLEKLADKVRLFLSTGRASKINIVFSEQDVDNLVMLLTKLSLSLLEELQKIKNHRVKNLRILRSFLIRREIRNFFRKFIKVFHPEKPFVTINFLNGRELSHIQAVFSFFDNPKMVFVTRDPRDMFISWLNHRWIKEDNVNYFVDYYGKQHADYPYKDKRILNIKFEDFVLNHDETSKKILDFIEVSPESYSAESAVYNVKDSIKNIGRWKQYPNQDVIKYIASELKDYLYEA